MLLPTFIVGLVKKLVQSPVIATITEGAIKITLFVAYIMLISRMKDIQRVFQYHGAEHKTIFCYENKDELTVENVRKYSRLHPRCGTSFLLIVMVVSIILFSFISWDSIITRMAYKLLLLPLVAGVSYEIIKYAGKSSHPIAKVISMPGMALQNLTTRDPDDYQIEVAITALKNVLPPNGEDVIA